MPDGHPEAQETAFPALNPRFVDMIIGFEALKLRAYLDRPGGTWTIGAGVTAYPDGRPVRQGDVLTPEQARAVSLQTMASFRRAVEKLIPGQPEHVIDAATSLAYNIGLGGGGPGSKPGFSESTCRKRLLAGDLKGACAALQWWNKDQNPKTGKLEVKDGLVTRRLAEAELMANGWDGGTGPAVPRGAVVENPPTVATSRKWWAAVVALLGAQLPWVLEVAPQVFGQGRDTYRQLVENGYDLRAAIAGAVVVTVAAGAILVVQHANTHSGRELPRSAPP